MLISYSYAATISGIVYTFDLIPTTAVIEINSSPLQRVIAVNGAYSINLNKGIYTINVSSKLQGTTGEILTIQQEGSFLHDIVLFPDLDREEQITPDDLNVEDLVVSETNNEIKDYTVWNKVIGAVGSLLFGGLICLIIIYKNKKRNAKIEIGHDSKEYHKPRVDEKEFDDELIKKVKEVLQATEGRITQKELRGKIPLSEAKISLLLTDMESLGMIRKIKKGRGNIIILK